jgi:hypothetical protein
MTEKEPSGKIKLAGLNNFEFEITDFQFNQTNSIITKVGIGNEPIWTEMNYIGAPRDVSFVISGIDYRTNSGSHLMEKSSALAPFKGKVCLFEIRVGNAMPVSFYGILQTFSHNIKGHSGATFQIHGTLIDNGGTVEDGDSYWNEGRGAYWSTEFEEEPQ